MSHPLDDILFRLARLEQAVGITVYPLPASMVHPGLAALKASQGDIYAWKYPAPDAAAPLAPSPTFTAKVGFGEAAFPDPTLKDDV